MAFDGRPNVTWRDPVVPIGVGHLLSILGWQVWLIRRDHRPFTHLCRHPLAIAFLGTFALHLLRLLGMFDPFTYANHKIPRRIP